MKRRAKSERVTLSVLGVVAREPVTQRYPRPSLVMTLDASTVEATVGSQRIVLDRTGCLVVPARVSLTLRSRSAAQRMVVLGFEDALLAAVARHYRWLELDREKLERWLAEIALLPRTVWVHEIVHRYVFERNVLAHPDNLTTRFLEIEILKEIAFLFRDREAEGADRASAEQRYSPVVERALAFIEAHLFDPCGMKELSRRSGASESTLLRSFRREIGVGPGEHWRMRRLEESLVLLRAGRYSVAEVATRAGYENPTSFGYAFRRRFGSPPSEFLSTRPTKRAP